MRRVTFQCSDLSIGCHQQHDRELFYREFFIAKKNIILFIADFILYIIFFIIVGVR